MDEWNKLKRKRRRSSLTKAKEFLFHYLDICIFSTTK